MLPTICHLFSLAHELSEHRDRHLAFPPQIAPKAYYTLQTALWHPVFCAVSDMWRVVIWLYLPVQPWSCISYFCARESSHHHAVIMSNVHNVFTSWCLQFLTIPSCLEGSVVVAYCILDVSLLFLRGKNIYINTNCNRQTCVKIEASLRREGPKSCV